jgi:UDP-N-acetylglucosamine 3-dehydrogenase
MSERLRVGVIGLGAFGESHLRAYQGMPEVEIAAVASRSSARAEDVAARYGVSCWYGSHQELIADPSIAAVSITTTEFEHRAPAIAALAAGKHVLVEKPIAATLEDARAMLAAARRGPGFLVPGHILRFDPAYAGAREAARAGELGRLVALTARRNRPQALIPTYGRVHPALITAIHDIDIMLWIAGRGVRWVRAIDRIASRDEGAHGLWGLLQFEHGVVATIETSWLIPDAAGVATDDALRITGLAGTATIQLDLPRYRKWRATGNSAPDVSYEPVLHGVVTGALRDELAAFARCALTGTPPTIVTPEDGCAALAVVLALIESARTGGDVLPDLAALEIGDPTQDRYRSLA